MHLAPCTMPLSPHASSFTVCQPYPARLTPSSPASPRSGRCFVDDELSPIMGIDKRSTSGAVEARSSPVASDLRFHASRTSPANRFSP
mmetsp:Transcript_16038/g.52833  ORF Transcript_16038/g.52833 Transcript_16038/m.52833 type:complete len:88 (-) Transcript_16038:929-1192(-)